MLLEKYKNDVWNENRNTQMEKCPAKQLFTQIYYANKYKNAGNFKGHSTTEVGRVGGGGSRKV